MPKREYTVAGLCENRIVDELLTSKSCIMPTALGEMVVREYSTRNGGHTVVERYIARKPVGDRIGIEVDSVPEEQRPDIAELLKKQGYREPIQFR